VSENLYFSLGTRSSTKMKGHTSVLLYQTTMPGSSKGKINARTIRTVRRKSLSMSTKARRSTKRGQNPPAVWNIQVMVLPYIGPLPIPRLINLFHSNQEKFQWSSSYATLM